MELGNWALISSPSLLALLPLIIFIVFALLGKGNYLGMFLGIIVGFFLTGQDLVSLTNAYTAAISSSTTVIGLLIMFGTGLGVLMTEARITHTLVYWIVKRIGINTRAKGKIVLILSSILVCGLLGTLAGGNAIISPILIPILAALGIPPTVVAVLFKVSGEIGLIVGPLTGVTLITMQVTGLSYGQLMLYAVIPFSLFWLTGAWIGCNRAQRLTEGTEHYELSSDISSIDSITPTPKEKRNTIIFLISFVVLITYGILMKQSTSYALTVMLLLAGIIILIAGFPVDEGVKMLSKGIGSQASTLVLLLNFTVMMDLVNAGEGFTALGNLLSGLAQSGGATALALVSAVVGGFGIETAAVLEIQIVAEMFGEMAIKAGLPMGVFAVSILAATRLTSSVYPTSNFIGQMITARCDNTKEALRANWIGAAFAWAFVLLYAFIGPMIF